MKRFIAMGGAALLGLGLAASLRAADEPPRQPAQQPAAIDLDAVIGQVRGGGFGGAGGGRYRDYQEVTRGAERIDGLFTLYKKDDHLYAEIKPFQFEQPFLSPIAIARGVESAGNPLNFGDEWVLVFRRSGDKVFLVRRNVHYIASGGSPLDKAVKQNYTDSILMALPIVSINPGGQAPLVDFADIYLSDFGQLGIGFLDRSRTSFHKVKAFQNNVEIEVEATFSGYGRSRMGGDGGVADPRGITMVIHYSLVKLPDPMYRPRYADDRVGHFLSAVKDFGKRDPDTNFVRQINRWRLEKSDRSAKLSPPRKQIVWWIEDTVPLEYRPAVEDGILEWNKAFEKIGISKALAVRWQEDGLRDEFDPEDVNYCTFRWITTSSTYAMSCLRANPITGEMIDGDVIFDASWIKAWKNEYALLTGNPPVAAATDRQTPPVPLAFGRVLSPILAVRQGFGNPFPEDLAPRKGDETRLAIGPPQMAGIQGLIRQRIASGQLGTCQFSSAMGPELGLAALAMASRDGDPKPGEPEPIEPGAKKPGKLNVIAEEVAVAVADEPKKDEPKKDEKKPEFKLPDELISQLIKEVVMHEVGHSLGLRHNFHASTMLNDEQINDTSITRVKGMVGSVMDYNPMNVAPKGKKQGDYMTTTIGPYDYWAIEYAYKPVDGDEATELKKIAARAPENDLAYGTDDDFSNNDPLVNAYDLGSDPNKFARDRIALATELMKEIDAKVVKDGESWARVRGVFSTLLSQWANGAAIVSQNIGGQYVSRNHKADKDARDPVIPVPGAKQRESLAFLVEEILSDKAFHFSPALLRKLTTERWYHWGDEGRYYNGSVDYPIHEEVLSIQKIVLGQCLAADVLGRLQNQEMMSDEGSNPLKVSDVFRSLTDGIWSECPTDGKGGPPNCSVIRRNLQREYLSKLSKIVLGQKASPYEDMYSFVIFNGTPKYPADAKALARMHLREIDERIGKAMSKEKVDDTTRAHLDECRRRIAKVLEAQVDALEP